MTSSTRVKIEKEIPFYDVDSYQIVWHGHYAKYFEEARCALLEKIGCNYQQMQRWGYFFPIVDLQVKYVRPLKFQQKVQVEAALLEWQNKLVIRYQIIDANSSETLTKGSTTQVAISMPDKVLQLDSPAQLIEKIEALIRMKT